MSLLIAAIGATVVAVLDVTLSAADTLKVGNAAPHITLVLGVIWTIAAGIDSGVVWAFVGGIILDALLGRPLGASAFSLIVAVGLARAMVEPLMRVRLLAPILAVPVVSFVYSLLLLVLGSAASPAAPSIDPVAAFVPSAIYDAVLALVLGPLVVSIRDRRLGVERPDW